MSEENTHENHGDRRQQHIEPRVLRHPAADQPRGTAHQRGLRLSGYAVQTAGRGAA